MPALVPPVRFTPKTPMTTTKSGTLDVMAGIPDDTLDDTSDDTSTLSDTARADRPTGPTGDGAGDEAGGDAGGEARYTIDELAGLSGVPSRTIRFYQSNGTLRSPEKRGRVAYYDGAHLARLRVIADLQERGLRLDAIRDVLGRMETGRDSLLGWLGVGDELQAPWFDERLTVLTHEELETRFADLRHGFIARLEQSNLIERQGNTRPPTYLVRSPALLEIAVRLERAGVDLEIAFGASEIMRKRISRAADELVPYFAEHAGRGFGRDGNPNEVASAYQSLRPLGLQAVQVIFAQEMERALRQFVESGKVLGRSKGQSRSRSRR